MVTGNSDSLTLCRLSSHRPIIWLFYIHFLLGLFFISLILELFPLNIWCYFYHVLWPIIEENDRWDGAGDHLMFCIEISDSCSSSQDKHLKYYSPSFYTTSKLIPGWWILPLTVMRRVESVKRRNIPTGTVFIPPWITTLGWRHTTTVGGEQISSRGK